MSEPAAFASDRLGNLRTIQIALEKRKNLYLINLLSKQKMPIRKGQMSFPLFHFWDLKLVPIDLALYSASGNLSHFFEKCSSGTKKSSQTSKFS